MVCPKVQRNQLNWWIICTWPGMCKLQRSELVWSESAVGRGSKVGAGEVECNEELGRGNEVGAVT